MDTPKFREWVSFEDEDGSTWHFDLTFLTSHYHCIYGRGCPGVLTELAPQYEHGCCTYGAHLVDEEDRANVEDKIAQLSAEEWQFSSLAADRGGAIHRNDAGELVTELVDDACILLNRVDFSGGAGCALHQGALARGERPIDWKPDVCWQLPLRYDEHHDEGGHISRVLREWQRRDWGEGGAEFAWWCTDDPLAFSNDSQVWKTLRDEIIELIGNEPYERLVEYILQREAMGTQVLLTHAQAKH